MNTSSLHVIKEVSFAPKLTNTLGQAIAEILYKHNSIEQIVHIGTKLEVEKGEGNEANHSYKVIQLCAKLHPLAIDGIHVFGLIEDDCTNQRWPTDLAGYIARTNSNITSQAQLRQDGTIGTRYTHFPQGIESLDDLIRQKTIAFRTSDYVPIIPATTLQGKELHQSCIYGANSELAEHAIDCITTSLQEQIKTKKDYMCWK
jgi:hypothetical protein